MATATKPEKKARRGRVRFEIQNGDKALAIHVDRQGFRRLVETLERLAETGESQTFEKSGRGRPSSGNETSGRSGSPAKLIFHIDDT